VQFLKDVPYYDSSSESSLEFQESSPLIYPLSVLSTFASLLDLKAFLALEASPALKVTSLLREVVSLYTRTYHHCLSTPSPVASSSSSQDED
jgi:hypothetical protein